MITESPNTEIIISYILLIITIKWSIEMKFARCFQKTIDHLTYSITDRRRQSHATSINHSHVLFSNCFAICSLLYQAFVFFHCPKLKIWVVEWKTPESFTADSNCCHICARDMKMNNTKLLFLWLYLFYISHTSIKYELN